MRRATFDGWAKRDGPEDTYPRTTALITPFNAGYSWAWSGYTTLIASTGTPFVPHMLHAQLRFLPQATAYVSYEYELATGAAGFEVPFARTCWAGPVLVSGALDTVFMGVSLSIPIGPKLIPSGTRLAHRARISAASGTSQIMTAASIAGYDGGKAPAAYSPYGHRAHLAGIHGAQSRVTPDGGTISILSGLSAYGAWVEVLAAASKDLLAWGATMSYTVETSARMRFMELGTGPNGFEVARARLPHPQIAYCAGSVQYLARPFLVKKGERFVARIMSPNARTFDCMFFYEEV